MGAFEANLCLCSLARRDFHAKQTKKPLGSTGTGNLQKTWDLRLQIRINMACSKRRATAVPNSNEFGLAVARRWHGSGFKRQT